MRARRSLDRRIGDFLHYPLSALEGKHGRTRELSQFRVILFMLTVTYILHWPATMTVWDWATITTLVLALPLADLFSAVPAKEALLALTAIFGSVVSKRTTISESTYTQESADGP